jgi:hypothetical protein
MNTTKWLAAGVGFAITLTACNRQDGKATFEYLMHQHQIVEQAKRNMRDHEIPKPPATPVFTKQTRLIDRIRMTKEYRQAVAGYYADVIQKSGDSENMVNDLQNQMSKVTSRGVDQEAMACVALQEQTLGDAAQMLVKLRAWANREQEDMRKPHPRDAALPHVVFGIWELTQGNPLGLRQIEKGMIEQGKFNSAKAAEQQHLDDLVKALEDASTKLASDGAELLTTRNKLVTKFGARYPHYEWNLLFADKSERADSANTQ